MALSKISEARDLSDQELSDQIVAVKRQLFELRMQKGTRQLEKPHQFKHARHRLAQLMTVEQERKRVVADQATAADAQVVPSIQRNEAEE